MDQHRTVTATFRVTFTLQVALGGDGSGTVTANNSDINCGTVCIFHYFAGIFTSLTATPATGSTFIGWSGGGCSGSGPCTVLMDQNRSVTAIFRGPGQPVPPEISNLRLSSEVTPSDDCEDSAGNKFTGNAFSVSFNYKDPDGDVFEGVAKVQAFGSDATDLSSFEEVDEFSGVITSRLCSTCGARCGVSVSVIDGSGLESNTLRITFAPDGTE
jgi:hypothetical protein